MDEVCPWEISINEIGLDYQALEWVEVETGMEKVEMWTGVEVRHLTAFIAAAKRKARRFAASNTVTLCYSLIHYWPMPYNVRQNEDFIWQTHDMPSKRNSDILNPVAGAGADDDSDDDWICHSVSVRLRASVFCLIVRPLDLHVGQLLNWRSVL